MVRERGREIREEVNLSARLRPDGELGQTGSRRWVLTLTSTDDTGDQALAALRASNLGDEHGKTLVLFEVPESRSIGEHTELVFKAAAGPDISGAEADLETLYYLSEEGLGQISDQYDQLPGPKV